MILTLNIDTDDATDLEALKAMMAVLCPEARKPIATCSSIMETARRRSAGEQVIYRSEPRKRGRKPKTATKE